MLKFNPLLILGFFSVLLSCMNAQEKILPYPIYQHKLANGLNVVTVPFDSPGLAAFYIVVRVGSRNEIESGVTGFAHFFEHMMFRGTDKYPREEYNRVLKMTGAGANANTSLDRTIYHMTGSADYLEKMFEVEADRFMNLHYSEHDFKTEAGAVKGEYTKNYASPYQQMYENLLNTAFDVHTYKHTTMGFFKDIVDMPNQYEYSLKFFKRFYRPEYSTIVVVGDVTAEKVNELAEKYFGKWEKGDYSIEIPVEPEQKEERSFHLQDGSIPPYLSMNYKGPAFSDTKMDMPALDVLNTILFSQNSSLYKKLVVEEQKLRFLGGGAMDSRDPYLITIQASFINKDDFQYVRDEITKAIDDIKKDGVDQKLLDETKSNLKYSYAMSIDNPDAIANSISHYIYLTGDPESLNRLYDLYDKVIVDDVKMVANNYFVDSGLTIATISSDEKGGVK
ncbi:MAG: insulinase family protein [Ignavibacteriaceae bacterium]|nr:insulinase family protein [Ignavibacteriaceae bacterium]MCW8813358.1 insulinase family protein [Chlorobium sp.]MCW8818251.1 insulinase family protein [Ignavibacteriaceae bacterium]MCW8822449.1 insulinase family protein [Ignavibacteriaceae bacterium]MCW9095821.1 insulinase family protein [Ignavibacteriaceae bacterium]